MYVEESSIYHLTDLHFQVFILIEHPVEREKLAVAQTLLKEQRENFLNLGCVERDTLRLSPEEGA